MQDPKRESPLVESLLVVGAFTILLLIAYAWSAGGGFLNWDDPKYVQNNPELRQGFAGAGTIFSTFYFANYNPLHRLSYLIEWQLFGDNATAFRITNLLLHLGNAILLFFVLRRWTTKLWVGALAAGLFLVHPANVETVAWISERKSLLATGFAFASVLCWLQGRQGLSWVLFTLGMLCKTSIVVLPPLLIALDWSRKSATREQWKWYAAFLVPAIALGCVQMAAAAATEAIRPLHGGSLVSHVATIIAVLPSYACHLVLPVGLTPRYEFHPAGLGDARFWLGLVMLGVIAWGALRSARGERRFAVGAAWFFAALLVTLIVPIPIILADRYLYFAMPLVLAVVVDAALRAKLPQPAHARLAVAGVAVVATLATVNYAAAWRDSASLWTHALHQDPANVEAWVSLGAAKFETGDLAAAEKAYGQAVKLAPQHADAVESLAGVELQSGQLVGAQRRLEGLLANDEKRGKARAMYAATFDLQGEVKRANAEFTKGLAAAPDDVGLVMNYVNFCQRHRRPRQAREVLEGFVQRNPGQTTAVRALRELGSTPPK